VKKFLSDKTAIQRGFRVIRGGGSPLFSSCTEGKTRTKFACPF